MELSKNDEGRRRIVKTRSEASRDGKPCSKIGAKLRSRRRSKLEVEEKKETSRLSMRTAAKSSSSESEMSPRFFTSKQRVELVNYRSSNFVPILPKMSLDYRGENKKNSEKRSSGNTWKNSFASSLNENGLDSKQTDHDNTSISRKKAKPIFSKKEVSAITKNENKVFGKKRSRSAPCTPLFKIKCSKNKFPRDFIVEGKSFAANEKIGNSGKNATLGLRISRSGDVSISSFDTSSNERIIERSGSRKLEDCNENDLEVNEIFVFLKKSDKLGTNNNNNNNGGVNSPAYFVNDTSIEECTEQKTMDSEEEIVDTKEDIIRDKNKSTDAKEEIIEDENKLIETEKKIIADENKSIDAKDEIIGEENTSIDAKEEIIREENKSIAKEEIIGEKTKLITEEEITEEKGKLIAKEEITGAKNKSIAKDEKVDAKNESINAEEEITKVEQKWTNLEKQITEEREKINETEQDGSETVKKMFTYESEERESERKNCSQKNSQVFFENVSNIESVEEAMTNDENRCPEETGTVEEVKKITVNSQNLSNKDQRKVIPEEYSSPRKLPRKREFRWETILEKYRRKDETNCDAVRAKKSVEIIEQVGDDKFKFWAEKEAENSQRNPPRKWRNAFEGNKLEAYRVIKQELPKLFMKRQISDAMRNKRIYEGSKISGQIDNSNCQILKNSDIICEPMILDEESSLKRPSGTNFQSKIRKFENLDNSDVTQKMTTKEGPNNSRPSILKRRKIPSPRRISFCLPARFVDQQSSEEKINVDRKMEDEGIDFVNSYQTVKSFDEEIRQSEGIRNLRGKQMCGRRDGYDLCSRKQAFRGQPNKSTMWNAMKNVTNSPCIHATERREDFPDSEDFEQDWETPTNGDIYCASEDVKFPKETREAMKALLRADKNPRRDCYDRCQKHEAERHRLHWRKIENWRRQNSQTVSSYLEAPEKCQQVCDRDCQRKLTATSRTRSSRNTDAAVGK